MQQQQRELFKRDRLLRLGEVERRLARVLLSPPSRPTLISYIESNRLRGQQSSLNQNWYVFESDLEQFIETYFPANQQIAA